MNNPYLSDEATSTVEYLNGVTRVAFTPNPVEPTGQLLSVSRNGDMVWAHVHFDGASAPEYIDARQLRRIK